MIRSLLKTLLTLTLFLSAIFLGYFISSLLEHRFLKEETEKQLALLLQGPVQIGEVHLALRGGLFIEGENVGAYPSQSSSSTHYLFSEWVSAEIDVTALLAGKFRLSGLLLRDVTFQIWRNSEGRWEPPPIEALAQKNRVDVSNPMDKNLDFLAAFEDVSRTLLSDVILADRFEVQNGTITVVDELTPISKGEDQLLQISVSQLNGRIVHHWLSGVVDLRLSTFLQGSESKRIPIRAEGTHNGAGDFSLKLAATDLPLKLIEPYLGSQESRPKIAGSWTGQLDYETHRLGHGALTADSQFRDLAFKIPDQSHDIKFAQDELSVFTHMEIDPTKFSIDPILIRNEGVVMTIGTQIERPFSEQAQMTLSAELTGLDLNGLKNTIQNFPPETSKGLSNFLRRVDTGKLQRANGSGAATLKIWTQLLSRELDLLPPGFKVSANLFDIQIRTGNDGLIDELSGTVELNENEFSLLNVTGLLNKNPLPTFNVQIHDFKNLLATPEEDRTRHSQPPGLSGIPAFLALFNFDSRDPTRGDSIRPELILNIERLEYPLFRWPIRDALVRIKQIPGGSIFEINTGTWAGAPFWGEARWTHATSNILNFEIWTAAYQPTVPPGTQEPEEVVPVSPRSPNEDLANHLPTREKWASGRFRIPEVNMSGLVFRDIRGFFLLQGQTLELHQIRSDLKPSGKLLGSADFNLGYPEHVPTESRFSIVSGDVESIGPTIGFSPGYATGRLHLSAELKGALRPQTPLLADLAGQFRVDARDGELQTNELPLLIEIAHASEGYNEYAQRDSIAFESIKSTLKVEDGRISTDDFKLEGPVRIYVSGTIDATRPPNEIIGVLGLFFFRGAGQIMERIPLVKAILPGSEKGLVGAYYQVDGTFDRPHVELLRGKSFAEDLPDVLLAPYALLNTVLTGGSLNQGQTKPDPIASPQEGLSLPSAPEKTPTVEKQTEKTKVAPQDLPPSENESAPEKPKVETQLDPKPILKALPEASNITKEDS